MPHSFAPPPAPYGASSAVAPRVSEIRAELRFDAASAEARAVATVDFTTGAFDGKPALDLRQELLWVRLDGKQVSTDDFAHHDMGAGWAARTRVLDIDLPADSHHRLEVGYELATPDCEAAKPIGWTKGGVDFDMWMSDLYPGRYLEMWVPAPLIHDRFALHLDITLDGVDRPHKLVANTGGVDATPGGRHWSLMYPAHYTALSPMLVIAPAERIETRRSALRIPGRSRSLGLVVAQLADAGADLAACEADLSAWLSYLSARYEPWPHGDTFWALIWGASRGMEYDAATTSAVSALEHEVFHSWFGRGVKPARAADGWIDEALASWSTSSRRSENPRFLTEELGLDDPPVELYPPHPWSRNTAVGAYSDGVRLIGGIAHLMGGADRMRAALADWYRANAGKMVTTDGLAAHLKAWSGLDIGPWWARYVHGRG